MTDIKRIAIALVGMSVAATLLTGCAENVHDSGLGEGANATESTMTAAPGPDGAPVETGASQRSLDALVAAGDTAQKAVDDSTVTTIVQRSTGAFTVKVATAAGTQQLVTASPDGQKKLTGPTPADQAVQEQSAIQQTLSRTQVAFNDAARHALQAVPGGSIQSIRLIRDTSSGQIRWKATIITELGGTNVVFVSADTGMVTHNTILD